MLTPERLLALGLMFPGAAFAQSEGPQGVLGEASVSGSDSFKLRYYRSDRTLPGFPDDDHVFDYFEAVNRINLLAVGEGWNAAVQADQLGIFWGKYYVDDQPYYDFTLHGDGVDFPAPMAYANVEKVWVSYQGEHVEVSVGDNYASFGRGMVFNTVKNTDIDIDTSIRGVQARVTAGMWDFTALTGLVNRQQIQLFNPNLQIRADKWHAVSGARLDRYGLGPANVGAHVVAYTFARSVPDAGTTLTRYEQPVDALVGGANVELFGVAGVDWYLEGNYFQHRSGDLFPDGEAEPGYATYASAALYPGILAILVEAKHTKNTERVNSLPSLDNYELAVGPTLEYERVITEDSSAAVNSNDISGARVQVDIAAKPGVLIPTVSLAAFRDRELGGLHFNRAPETILHPVVGVQYFGEGVHLLLNAGFRVDIRDEGPNGEDLGSDRMAHGDVSLGFPLGKMHGELDAYVQRFWWGENVNQQHDYTIATVALAAHVNHGVTAVLYSDFSNDPLIDSTGNITDSLYAAGELQWQPREGTTLKAFYGAYRAGIRCAGGQCRLLPGFEGARVEATVDF
ncbi:MAG: hypothetical protein H6741_28390 [Alphaproteobacteria bacterium]|nr:hypothetical protein [Alphaproteobacteria bacterium]MCB9796636.1 hypothetical protein [Alphaproteobacteria bacterium]